MFKRQRRMWVTFPAAKMQAALRDCEAMRALPCDASKRAQILATKVLPQIAFAPQLNFIPKRLLARLQSAVADALWQDRPKWRSKHLLLCIVHKAHRLDPFPVPGCDNYFRVCSFLAAISVGSPAVATAIRTGPTHCTSMDDAIWSSMPDSGHRLGSHL